MIKTMRKVKIADLKDGDLLFGNNGKWYEFEYLKIKEGKMGYVKLRSLDEEEGEPVMCFHDYDREIMVGEKSV